MSNKKGRDHDGKSDDKRNEGKGLFSVTANLSSSSFGFFFSLPSTDPSTCPSSHVFLPHLSALQATSKGSSRTAATASYTADEVSQMRTHKRHLLVVIINVNCTIFVHFQVSIDDSDEDIPVMKATRPPPRHVFQCSVWYSSPSGEKPIDKYTVLYINGYLFFNVCLSLVYYRAAAPSSSSFTKYSSQSQSQSSRGIAFDDSDDDDDEVKD